MENCQNFNLKRLSTRFRSLFLGSAGVKAFALAGSVEAQTGLVGCASKIQETGFLFGFFGY